MNIGLVLLLWLLPLRLEALPTVSVAESGRAEEKTAVASLQYLTDDLIEKLAPKN